MRAPFATSLPILLLLGISALMPLRAQLAITEVMSSASTNLGISRVGSRSDFWELTNFGTNAIDLSDYRFNDEGGVGGATNIFNDITILGGESIIFAQEASPLCTNAAQFKAWWGEANLPTNLQVFFYTGHGFSAIRDAVQLWHVTGVSTTLVQRVELYEARRGFTFEYDITTGLLDELSTPGDPHVFKAAETDDFGSAGYTRGAVPLALQEQPRAVTTDLGASSVFRVRATGLPVPTFQWLRDGSAISGATSNELYIPVTLLADAGSYSVQVANGLTSLISSRAVLTVSTLSNAPVVLQGPADLMVTPGQTAVFTVLARGYPLP
ncbi:MAG TPA: hypothetical protein VMZ27_08110, partial [Candidatus Saccharimonadales bacterium]|nr:hypothetical protein [Candidatus Saccharimonadales bacterium]